jgi:hypothetical protein
MILTTLTMMFGLWGICLSTSGAHPPPSDGQGTDNQAEDDNDDDNLIA